MRDRISTRSIIFICVYAHILSARVSHEQHAIIVAYNSVRVQFIYYINVHGEIIILNAVTSSVMFIKRTQKLKNEFWNFARPISFSVFHSKDKIISKMKFYRRSYIKIISKMKFHRRSLFC